MKVSFLKMAVVVAFAGACAVYATPVADFVGNFEPREDGNSPSRGWSTTVNSGGAAATSGVDSITGTAKEGQNFYRINVTAVSDQNWHIQLMDPTWVAKKGATYHISYWVRAEAEHKVLISVYGGAGDKTKYRTSTEYTIGTEWQQIDQVFAADTAGAGAINFALVVGGEVGIYDIDGVELDEAYDETNPNIYPNGGFEAKGAGWNLWVSTDSVAGVAAVTFPETGAQEGTRFCRVSVTTAADQNYKVQLQDGSWNCIMDSTYTISFWAKSAEEATFDLAVSAGKSREYAYITGKQFTLTPEWAQYEYVFFPEDTLKLGGTDSLTFAFYVGGVAATYDFDDVILTGATKVDTVAVRTSPALRNTARQLSVARAGGSLQCVTALSAVSPFTVNIFNVQGRLYSSSTITTKGTTFSLPCPPSGTWIVKTGSLKETVVVP